PDFIWFGVVRKMAMIVLILSWIVFKYVFMWKTWRMVSKPIDQKYICYPFIYFLNADLYMSTGGRIVRRAISCEEISFSEIQFFKCFRTKLGRGAKGMTTCAGELGAIVQGKG
ncbi:hypothetical protein ACJX0J_006499, partial [Zea mays]